MKDSKEYNILFKILIIILYIIFAILSIYNHKINNLSTLITEILVYLSLALGILIFLFSDYIDW